MAARTNMHLALLEIAFNAAGPDGRPLLASIPLDAHTPALEQIMRHGQQAGELRNFDIEVMAGLLRSAVTHTMVLALRANPAIDLAGYASELATAFHLATSAQITNSQ